jgi:hypothetical protein
MKANVQKFSKSFAGKMRRRIQRYAPHHPDEEEHKKGQHDEKGKGEEIENPIHFLQTGVRVWEGKEVRSMERGQREARIWRLLNALCCSPLQPVEGWLAGLVFVCAVALFAAALFVARRRRGTALVSR